MMKALKLSALILVSGFATAGTNQIGAGYAHTSGDGAKLNGGALSYAYEFDNQWQISSHVTLTGATDEYKVEGYKVKETDGYGSVTVGAGYRINDYIAPFVEVGAARVGVKVESKELDESITDHASGVAYTVGARVYPVKNWFVDVAYQGAHIGKDVGQLNSFIIGGGYSF
ncbi:hypothetical protein CHT48_18555 [Salmonella enterica subsp. enterica serovar Mississippi]|nr:hypothetical protein [Salmonella enterica subsp. enterica serovar Mississippi]EEC4817434.1 outer membrane beta-barrel protein [Salmonella enterica]EEK3137065.1 outer membrane beta-barrel protein [Salmonella enterica]EKJ5693539.1 outer membrane beta-barrel protein [Salmonella enterica]HEC7438161.1 outer membrane beta-barrel protein [Salmonella enterica subsp. enterica serovar Mississippi]